VTTLNVFISHKRANGEAVQIARNIAERLTAEKFYVFIDVLQLDDADLWRDRIISEVQKADVLLVLLQAKTAESDWIQREVDMARGLGIRIIPILIDKLVDVKKAEERLELGGIQWVLNFDESAAAYERLINTIRRRAAGENGTWPRQQQWIEERHDHWRPVKATDQLSVYHVPLPGYTHGCELHLATGDITRLRRRDGKRVFDVIVNTENDHMQMARIFERDRLSSALRREGAYVDHTGALLEDTVQKELDLQIDTQFRRPLTIRQVIPTHAGHIQSRLVRNTAARYIFHAATAHVDDTHKPGIVNSIVGDAINDAVYNCLELIHRIDVQNGQIFREGTEPFLRDKDAATIGPYTPIESIIFPLFGTGHGGLDVESVAQHMLQAFREFPQHNPLIEHQMQLKRIYLSVFAEDHVPVVRAAIEEMFGVL